MKKLLVLISFLLLASSQLIAGNVRFNAASGRMVEGKNTWVGYLTWNKTVNTGSDSLFTSGKTYGTIVGAKDTLYTDSFRNKGVTNLQLRITSGTTVRLKVVIQVANSAGEAYTMEDSDFENAYWLVDGTGIIGCAVSTSEDSVVATGNTTTIGIPLLGGELFRVLVYSSSQQSGNTKIEIAAILKEE